MKLQDKKEILEAKNNDRALEIREGAKLARKIDVLRQTASEEETKLSRFREATLARLREETKEAALKRDAIKDEVARLEEERIRAEAPIDLVTEWEKVRSDQVEIQGLKDDLFSRETHLIAGESTVARKEQEFLDREEQVKESEEFTNRLKDEATKAYEEADAIRARSEDSRVLVEKTLEKRNQTLSIREKEAQNREYDLSLTKDQLDKERQELDTERIHIESQQQSLRIAWENIRNMTN